MSQKFHFDTRPRRESDPRMVIVIVMLAFALVVCVACGSLVMSVCCSVR